GLIHVSEMSWTKKNVHPGKIVSTSQEVDVQILEVDPVKRRISLGLKQTMRNPWEAFVEKYRPGEQVIEEYKKGDKVKAKVLDVDVEKERISLGIKQLAGDPLESAAELKK